MNPPSRASAGGSSISPDSIVSRTSPRSSSSGQQRAHERRLARREHGPDAGDDGNRRFEADEIAGTGRAERRSSDEPLEILDRLDRVAELAALGRPERQILDRVEAIANAVERDERPQQPRPQHAGCRAR